MKTATIRELKVGECFRRVKADGSEGHRVFVRGEHNRSSSRYVCNSVDDIWGNGLGLKGSTVVSIGFTY